MRELYNNYADVSTKQGKPNAREIKQKNQLLDPEKPIPHPRGNKTSEKELKEMKKHFQVLLYFLQPLFFRERLDTAQCNSL